MSDTKHTNYQIKNKQKYKFSLKKYHLGSLRVNNNNKKNEILLKIT